MSCEPLAVTIKHLFSRMHNYFKYLCRKLGEFMAIAFFLTSSSASTSKARPGGDSLQQSTRNAGHSSYPPRRRRSAIPGWPGFCNSGAPTTPAKSSRATGTVTLPAAIRLVRAIHEPAATDVDLPAPAAKRDQKKAFHISTGTPFGPAATGFRFRASGALA